MGEVEARAQRGWVICPRSHRLISVEARIPAQAFWPQASSRVKNLNFRARPHQENADCDFSPLLRVM